MKTKDLGKTGVSVPVIGMGTWNVAPPDQYAPEHADEREVARALQYGIELGLSHIDTAEMYGSGRAESIIGRAIQGIPRDKLFIATKMEPEHFTYDGVLGAASGSLRRLGTDYIDLYQLHWPYPEIPVGETMRAMEHLVDNNIIRFIGVSNFSVAELVQAQGVLSKYSIVSNQVKYNLLDRIIERDLLPFAEANGITIIAYSPFATGALFGYTGANRSVVDVIARKYNRSFAQVCLNWLISKEPVITIPKAIQIAHLDDNAAAADWEMDKENTTRLTGLFYSGVKNAIHTRLPICPSTRAVQA